MIDKEVLTIQLQSTKIVLEKHISNLQKQGKIVSSIIKDVSKLKEELEPLEQELEIAKEKFKRDRLRYDTLMNSIQEIESQLEVIVENNSDKEVQPKASKDKE